MSNSQRVGGQIYIPFAVAWRTTTTYQVTALLWQQVDLPGMVHSFTFAFSTTLVEQLDYCGGTSSQICQE